MDLNVPSATSTSLSPEDSSDYVGRISRVPFQALIGVMYGLAMISALTRLALQLRVHRRLYLDDWLLIFATMTLTASTVLGYVNVGALYWSQELNYNQSRIYELLAEHVDIAAHINAYERLYYTYPSLLWASIFAVKFAYLAFLRRLVDRIKPLIGYWRVVVGVTAIAFPICVISVYVGCIKWGLDAVNCTKPVYFHRALALSITDAILDIGTDIMIITLPIRLLWSVQIRLRQKLVLGIFLSLNVFMAITACVRVSGIDFRGRFDEVWLFVWQYIEACVAVAMISLTAFRSVFVGPDSLQARKKLAKRQWYSSSLQAFKRKKVAQENDTEAMLELPSIPGGTLTGMRTFIHGGKHAETDYQTNIPTSGAF